MSKKKKAVRLLNEALTCREITGVGLDFVEDEVHGDGFRPFLEIANCFEVGVSFILQDVGDTHDYVLRLESRFTGQTILAVERYRREDGKVTAGLSLSDHYARVPIWNIDILRSWRRCELNKVLLSAGLQVPYEIADTAWYEEDDDVETECEVDEDEGEEDDTKDDDGEEGDCSMEISG